MKTLPYKASHYVAWVKARLRPCYNDLALLRHGEVKARLRHGLKPWAQTQSINQSFNQSINHSINDLSERWHGVGCCAVVQFHEVLVHLDRSENFILQSSINTLFCNLHKCRARKEDIWRIVPGENKGWKFFFAGCHDICNPSRCSALKEGGDSILVVPC